jgi:hypothetical protein
VTRERLALEEAIRKVEAESARKTRSETPREPAGKVRVPDASRWEAASRWEEPSTGAEPTTPPPRRSRSTSLRSDPGSRRAAQAQAADEARPRPTTEPSERGQPFDFVAEQADNQAEASSAPPARARKTDNERRSLLDAGLQDFHGVVSESEGFEDVSTWASRPSHDTRGSPLSQPADLDQQNPQMLEPQELQSSPSFDSALEPSGENDAERSTPLRGRAVQISEEEFEAPAPRRSYRDLIRVGAALVLLLGVCGVLAWQWPKMAAFYHNLRSPAATEVTSDNTTASTESHSKFTDRIEPGGQNQQSATLTPSTPNAAPAAAVAQHVVLYEEDPPNPEPKRYVGSAIWRTEMISPGEGRPPELAIRADVEIPERGIAMTMLLRRNTDKDLSASHTVEITFRLSKEFPEGGIYSVPGFMMKQGEGERGIPIAGSSVKVTDGYFLIGLSSIEAAKDRNIQLLRDREWFDIMLVYNNKRRAILALEKGAAGDAVFQQAFAAWAKAKQG